MDARELFDEILEATGTGSREEIENSWPGFQDLKSKDCNSEAIYLTIELWACIAFFHLEIFGEGTLNKPEFIYGGNPNDWYAHYSPDDDSYGLYLEHFERNIEGFYPLVLVSEGESFDIKEDISHNTALSLISLASHEVRHRFQYKNNFELFSLNNSKSVDDGGVFSEYAYYCEECLFPSRKEILKEQGESEEYIKDRTSPIELDASIIEHFIGGQLYQGLEIDEIIEIITLTPNGSSL